MATDSTITREQLATLYLNTELGGNTRHLNHFSYAEKGSSTYSFRAGAVRRGQEPGQVVGMSQVDIVVARPDGQGVFAVQGQLGDPAAHRTYIDLAQAVGQDLRSSTRQSEALNAEQTQRQAQAQQPLSR